MKTLFIIFISLFLLCNSLQSLAQEPFSSLVVSDTRLQEVKFNGKQFGLQSIHTQPEVLQGPKIGIRQLGDTTPIDTTTIVPQIEGEPKADEDSQNSDTSVGEIVNVSEEVMVDIFSSSGSGIDLGSGISLPRLKVGFIYYKLGLYTTKQNRTTKAGTQKPQKTYFLPLFFFTRLTTDYTSTSSAAGIDAIDYDGAPVTVRLMPSFSACIGAKNAINYGLIVDYRGLNYTDSTGGNQYKSGIYIATGIRYSGQAQALTSMADKGANGKWNLSLLFSSFHANSALISNLFYNEVPEGGEKDLKHKSVQSFQVYLSFKAYETEKSSVNFSISYLTASKNFILKENGHVFKFTIGVNI